MISHLISRIRRNHGLEHASIHVLSETHKNFSAQGNSNHKGFTLNIYGDINEGDVIEAVETAFKRMKAGEHHLAVHPNCGTVLLTTATMATLAVQTVFGLESKRQERLETKVPAFFNALPSAILAVVVSLIVSRPVGLHIQERYTTEGDLGDMHIVRIRPVKPSPVTRFFQLLLTGGRGEIKAKSYVIETAN